MKQLPFTLLLFAFLFLYHHPAGAQQRWQLTLTPAAAFASQDVGEADLNTGFGFDITVGYRFQPHLGAYAGWGWTRFAAKAPFAGTNNDVEETGYVFGLRFQHPIASSRLRYQLFAGGIYNHLEVENEAGDITADSGHGLGWQAGAGLVIPVGRQLSLVPGLRYQSLSRELVLNNRTMDADLRYFAFGIGIQLGFGKDR